MATFCELDDVKRQLGIKLDDSTFDDQLNGLIESASADFMREIRRPDFNPSQEWTERLCGDGSTVLYLKHYPVNSIVSVTVNGEELEESTDGMEDEGFFFDDSVDPEDRQKITRIGSVWPCSWRALGSAVPNILVVYTAGYDEIPADVSQAVTEWVAWKRGYSQLQSLDQGEVTWQQIGQYQQAVTPGKSTLEASGFSTPQSVSDVIAKYLRQASL